MRHNIKVAKEEEEKILVTRVNIPVEGDTFIKNEMPMKFATFQSKLSVERVNCTHFIIE